MERAGDGAGDAAPTLRQTAPGNSGPRLVRRPRVEARHLGTRAAAGLRPEALRPPARSLLTEAASARQVTADALAQKGEPAPDLTANRRRSRKRGPPPQGRTPAMERRKARRPRHGRSSPSFRRWALPRGGPRVRPDLSAPASSC